jgi:hypothetical protein
VDNSDGGCGGLFTVEGMRTAAVATALGLVLITAGLTSCATPKTGLQPPEPDPTATPVYASEEEALAAAEELYGRYLKIANKLGQSGWTWTQDLDTVLSGRALEGELQNAADFAAKGLVQHGDSTFDSQMLQQLRSNDSEQVSLTIYLCLDVSGVDVVDKQGESVVSPGRPDRQALEIDMDGAEGALRITRSEAWSGANFC